MRMRNISGILSETLCLAFALTVGARAQGGSFLQKGDRWVLVGDSITQTNTYRQILQQAKDIHKRHSRGNSK